MCIFALPQQQSSFILISFSYIIQLWLVLAETQTRGCAQIPALQMRLSATQSAAWSSSVYTTSIVSLLVGMGTGVMVSFVAIKYIPSLRMDGTACKRIKEATSPPGAGERVKEEEERANEEDERAVVDQAAGGGRKGEKRGAATTVVGKGGKTGTWGGGGRARREGGGGERGGQGGGEGREGGGEGEEGRGAPQAVQEAILATAAMKGSRPARGATDAASHSLPPGASEIWRLWFDGGNDLETNYRQRWFCAPGSARQLAFDREVRKREDEGEGGGKREEGGGGRGSASPRRGTVLRRPRPAPVIERASWSLGDAFSAMGRARWLVGQARAPRSPPLTHRTPQEASGRRHAPP